MTTTHNAAGPSVGSVQGAADQIVSVSATQVRLPLHAPVRNGSAVIAHRDYVVVTVQSAGGRSGTGVAFTRGAPLATIIEDSLAPTIVGRSPFEVQRLWDEMYTRGELFMGRSGAFMRALSILDIAIWDLKGKLAERSLAADLGGEGATIPLMLSLGYYRSDEGLDDLVATYAQYAQKGFRRFKIMAGGALLLEDRDRLRAVAEVLPPGSTLAVDVNGTFATASEALRFVDSIDLPLDFVEDPFRPDNVSSAREFKRHSTIPVAVGEWESGRHRFRELLEQDLVDIVRLDATACGGVSEWLKIAGLARSFGKRILPHYYPEIHVHLAAATPGAEAIEVVPASTGADNFDRMVVSGPWQELPTTPVSNSPGLGLEWNWSVIGEAHL